MKINIALILSAVFCVIATAGTIWISSVNLEEIVNRANGRYTFFSQRASLSDDEAIIYFGCWTILLVIICFLAIRSWIKQRYVRSIIYAVSVILAIVLSASVDSMFYYDLV